MPTVRSTCFLLASLLPLAPVTCQQAPLRPAPAPITGGQPSASTPVMLATERFLFVLRGDELCQFDVETLQLLHSHRFGVGHGGGGQAAATRRGAPPVLDPPVADEPVGVIDGGAVHLAIDAALAWLDAHQDENGKWDCDQFMKHDDAARGAVCDGPGNAVHDVGVTALAALAMLGGGSTMRTGPYKDALKKAVSWLREQQQENGLVGHPVAHDFIYDHAIATYALSEAYGLSNYKLLQPVVQKAVNYLELHRNPYAVWRYQPRDGDNDTSVTTWALLAVTSARHFGVDVNPTTFAMGKTWLDQVTGPDGRVGYTKQGEGSSRMPGQHVLHFPPGNVETLTAGGLFARLMMGEEPASPAVQASAQVLLGKPPRWEDGHIDAVYWFFGALDAFQLGGEHWHTWSASLAKLLDHQRADGNAVGSWDTLGVWDETGGRVFVTALYTLALETVDRSIALQLR